MQLITLNVWGGRILNPVLDFFRNNIDIDVFCLQEVYHNAVTRVSDEQESSLNLFSQIQEILKHHTGFFRPVVENSFGQALFVSNKLDILGEGEVFIHDNPDYPGYGPTHPRNLQWLEVKTNHKIYNILNVHGLWNGMGKTDTEARIVQSNRIRQFMDTLNTPKIVCGDFNLRPDTQSLEIVANGMTDLVKVNKVQSTRTAYYSKAEKFADYIFTSPEIQVHDFKVMPDEVSDHAALCVNFD